VCGATPARAGDAPSALSWVRGTVEYQLPNAAFRQLAGQLTVPDATLAVTLADSRALLQLPDSSEVDIGAKARLLVGAVRAAEAAQPTVLTLQLGAIHFVIRHPVGARANYIFSTPTAQIAVRGSEGYIVAGPRGTDFYCADCGPSDVTIHVGARTFAVTTGQQLIVVGGDPATADTTLVKLPCGNPAAIAISDGKLGRTIPPDQRVDTTGSLDADPLAAPASPTPSPSPYP
jgi:hypothetical protein